MGMKQLILILLIAVLTSSPVSAGIVAWDFSGSGFWSTATNWNTDKVPGRGDDVVISSGIGAVTITSNANINKLTLGGTQNLVLSTSRITINNYVAIASDSNIDVHLHASIHETSAAPQDLVTLMTDNKFSIFIVMETPKPIYKETDLSSAESRDFFSAYPGSFLFMYGGSELQPFLYAAGYRGTTITLTGLYPNGGAEASQEDIDQLNAIHTNSADWESEFKARATQAAESGLYVGFGEIAPLHYSLREGHPYMDYKIDTPWMFWLSDLAASHNMVLDIHFEARETTLAEFATLLSHNTNTRIIWDHAGWCNVDPVQPNPAQANAATISGLMAAHPNLYLSLKMRKNAPLCSPTDSSDNLRSEWQTLLTTYADRIMVGTDAKYWSDPATTLGDELKSSYNKLDSMLKLLSPDTAQKIRNGSAKALFGL
jgi:hypothetical protein